MITIKSECSMNGCRRPIVWRYKVLFTSVSFVCIEDVADDLNILKDEGLRIVVALVVRSLDRKRRLRHPQYKIEVILIGRNLTTEKSESIS